MTWPSVFLNVPNLDFSSSSICSLKAFTWLFITVAFGFQVSMMISGIQTDISGKISNNRLQVAREQELPAPTIPFPFTS